MFYPSSTRNKFFLFMAYENLHKEIKKGCDCCKYGIAPIPTDVFYRRGKNLPPVLADFFSYFEEGRPLRRNDTDCVARCHHRGISMDKITMDLALAKKILKESAQVKPIVPPIVYFFRIKDEAGLVWYNQKSEKLHCELLKSDEFSVDGHLEFLEKFDSSEAL